MPLTLNTLEDEQAFEKYKSARRKIQQVVGNGIYPNVVVGLTDFLDFGQRVAVGDLAQFAEYYGEQLTETGIGSHLNELVGLLMATKAKIELIETGYPGTFGIALPQPESEELPV